MLNVAFGEPTLAVDTHVFRVANRTGLAPGKTPLEVEDGAAAASCRRSTGLHAHHWLILHGRYVCKARRPECPSCIIRDLCLYDAKTPGIGVSGAHGNNYHNVLTGPAPLMAVSRVV